MPLSNKTDEIYQTWNEIPENIKLSKEVLANRYLINGVLRISKNVLIDSYSPIAVKENGKLRRVKLGAVAYNSTKDSLEALNAAEKAYANGLGKWSRTSIDERAKAVERFIELLQAKKDQIIKLIIWETGKSLAESAMEFDRTVVYINGTIAEAREIESSGAIKKTDGDFTAKFWRAPLGIVLCSGPANYPLFETYSLIIPALIMGNCVIFKAPQRTPLLHAELIDDINSSFPAGSISVLFGDGAETLAPIVESGKLDSFIYMGSNRAIENLSKMHPKPYRFKTIFGLSAKNIAIVANSANVAQAAKDCALGAYAFNGQRCAAIKQIFVHSNVASEFKTAFIREMENTKIGMPWQDGVKITPLQSPERLPQLESIIDDAIANGAELLCPSGESLIGGILAPIALWNVSKNARIYIEEQFAPIAPVVIYNDINEPLEYLAQSDYGQQLSIFSENKQEIIDFVYQSRGLVGRINVNHKCQRGPDSFPFTARKDSANAEFSIKVTLEDLSVATVLSTKNAELI